MPWNPVTVPSDTSFQPSSIATPGSQFYTLGPTGLGTANGDYVRFTAQVNENEAIVLTEDPAHYLILNDVPARQP